MPTLQPLRRVEAPGVNITGSYRGAAVESTASQEAESSSTVTSSSSSLVFGDEEFAYLESIDAQSSTASRRRERGSDDLDQPRYTDLENAVMKNLKLRPVFSPIASIEGEFLETLPKNLRPKTETAHFEIHCDSRTNPQSNYVPTIITVPTTQAILERVVTPWETYGDVIWDAVNKRLDFQILLQAREGVIHDTKSALGRTDVKPFSTFRKKLSLGTDNSHITCYNIRDKAKSYLEIRNIIFKKSSTYERSDQLAVVIHKVQELEIKLIDGLDAVRAEVHDNCKTWYEIEIYNEKISQRLESNIELIPGTVADWEVSDLIGGEELWNMVKELMNRVDNPGKIFPPNTNAGVDRQ
ncbi:hypothetical protein BGZ65_010243 [Modicella reniformis]|uniref:DUF7905 domain-containing protein n=1 Tax=Modicella reniformis TaxID=1440133 RepID=A0A9P6SRI6_9FUNG|nr:hypothetical protein BGZ65_010243 [Modicella reniformis]